MARLLKKPIRFNLTVSLAGLALALAIPMNAQSSATDPAPAASTDKASAGSQDSMRPAAVDPKAEPAPPASPEEIRQGAIKEDTKRLFQLSAELRAEVAKTYKESLSLTVLKKAEEIEKLAKSLKALMNRDAAVTAKRGDQ